MPVLPWRLVRDAAWPGMPSRAPVTGSSTMRPADLRLLRLGGGGEQGALLRVEHAGFLELAVALERLDGGDGLVVELAVDQAVVVAGPGQIELDGDALGERQRGIAAVRRRGRVLRGGGRGVRRCCAGDWRRRLCGLPAPCRGGGCAALSVAAAAAAALPACAAGLAAAPAAARHRILGGGRTTPADEHGNIGRGSAWDSCAKLADRLRAPTATSAIAAQCSFSDSDR